MENGENSVADFEREIRGIFLNEAKDLLESVEDWLLKLENGGPKDECVAAIFRVAHTFKGNSLSVGYKKLGEFSHHLESLLDRIRKGEVEADRTVMNTLLAAIDILRSAVTELCRDGSQTGFAGIDEAKLQAVLSALQEPSTSDGSGTRQSQVSPAESRAADAPGEEREDLSSLIARFNALDANKSATSTPNPLPRGSTGVADPVYFFPSLEAGAEPCFSPEDSKAIEACRRLLARGSVLGSSKELVKELRKHPRWKSLDRICVVERVSRSLFMRAIDSHSELGKNPLETGYSCYVSNDSSLARIPKGCARIYDRVLSVMDSYRDRGAPFQSAFKKIVAHGMQSGACLPLLLGKNAVGYLFLNSHVEGYFSSRSPEDFALLGILATNMTLLMAAKPQAASPEFLRFVATLPQERPSHARFDAGEFSTLLRHELGLRGNAPQVEIRIEDHPPFPFLASTPLAAHSAAQVIMALNHARPSGRDLACTFRTMVLGEGLMGLSVRLQSSPPGTVVQGHYLDLRSLRWLANECAAAGFKLEMMGPEEALLKFPAEECESAAGVDYST